MKWRSVNFENIFFYKKLTSCFYNLSIKIYKQKHTTSVFSLHNIQKK